MFPSLADLRGRWQLERSIAHADGTIARFRGVARFVMSEPVNTKRLTYTETGELELATGHRLQAERVYLWRAGEGRALEVFFDDGRPFHTIDPNQTQAQHWCDPDQYDVAYDFENWPLWSSRWSVTGPRKSYSLVSQYKP